jgi:hypothetical protein
MRTAPANRTIEFIQYIENQRVEQKKIGAAILLANGGMHSNWASCGSWVGLFSTDGVSHDLQTLFSLSSTFPDASGPSALLAIGAKLQKQLSRFLKF